MNKLAAFALVLMTLGGATVAYSISYSISHMSTATVTVTIPPPPPSPDFTVTQNIPFGSVQRGETSDYNVTLTNQSSSQFAVTINVTYPNNGLNITLMNGIFPVSSVSLGPYVTENVTLRLTVGADVPVTFYTIPVKFTGTTP
jgi:hypothetical protein